MEAKVNKFALPGDVLRNCRTLRNAVIVGPGLNREGLSSKLIVTRPGVIRHKLPNVYWVQCRHYKYSPNRGDFVVGVITKKAGESYRVDIGTADAASISMYAFEGATKRQQANIAVGDAIYGRVLSAHKEMEPDLVCVDQYLRAFNYGKLVKEGMIVQIPMQITNKLLTARMNFLRAYGKKHPLEIAIGNNGLIWLNTKSCKETLKLLKAVYSAKNTSNKKIKKFLRLK